MRTLVAARTGLVIDPYFCASKIAWLLDNVPGARADAEAGRLAFGTVDSWLLWRLTEGRVHATDATNASRTMLFDITRGAWDPELLDLFRIPASLLPEVRDSSGHFGMASAGILGAEIAVMGIAGDQQAACVGQACFAPGMVKSTYGTGCFLLLNVGAEPVMSRSRMLTTIAWQIGGVRSYALEGAIFVAGAAVQWLRDGLGVIGEAARDRRARRRGRSIAARLSGARLHRSRRAALGCAGAGRPVRPDPQYRPRGAGARRAGKRGLPDPRPDRGDAGGLGERRRTRIRRRRCCGWMAAWRPAIGPCSSWPT